MPLGLRDLAPFLTSPEATTPYDGKLGAAVRDARRLDQDVKEQDRRFALSQEHEARLAEDQKARRQIDLGQLELQRGQLQRNERQDVNKLFDDYQTALRNGDAPAIDAAAQELSRAGYPADRPESAWEITEAKPPGGEKSAAAPADGQQAAAEKQPVPQKEGLETTPAPAVGPKQKTPAEQQLAGELSSMRQSIRQTVPLPPAPSASATTNRQVKQLELSPGDSLLQLKPGAAAAPAAPAAPQPAPEQPSKLSLEPGLTPKAPEQPAKPSGPRKLTVRDPGGRVVFEADPRQLDDWRRARVTQTFAPIASSGNEIQTAAAKKAMESTLARVGTAPLEKLIAAGLEQYEKEVDQLMGVKRAAASRTGDSGTGGGYGGSGMSKSEFAVSDANADVVQQHVEKVKQQYGYKGLSDIEQHASRVVAAIDQKTGQGDLAAITSSIAALQGGRVSDNDMKQALKSGGLRGAVENLLGYGFNEGKMSPEAMRKFRALASAVAATARDERYRAAQQAESDIRDIGGLRGWSPEASERGATAAYNLMLGSAEGRKPLPQRAPKKASGGGGAPAAPSGKPGATKPGAQPGTVAEKWRLKLRASGGD